MPSSVNKQYRFQLRISDENYDIYYFQGSSGLHDFYRFGLEMIAESKLDCNTLVGNDAHFSIHATVEGDLLRKPKIEFAGKIVSAASIGRRGGNDNSLFLYRLEFVSHIYKTSLSRRYRFFLDKKSTEICQEVLGRLLESVNDIQSDNLMDRELCTQYGESDWDFVKRVAAADGCFFVNNYGKGTLKLVCGSSYRAEGSVGNSAVLEEKAQEIISGMQGLHYDWHTPDFAFEESEGQDASDYQFYYPDIEKRGGLRASGLKQKVNYEYRNQALWRNSYMGTSEESDVREGLYYDIRDQKVLVTKAEYEGYEPEKFSNVNDDQGARDLIRSVVAQGQEAYYTCRFTAINPGASGFVAPIGEKPKIYGIQTAIVVSENGDEINVGEKGAVRVRFHWDRGERQSPHGICRIRSISPWSGDGFGMQFFPRKGQEVAVSFIGGDIDRPVLTGMLYNGGSKTPWDPCEEAWVSGIRTKSVPENSQKSAYNELSFHDKLGEEKIVLHAERDLKVEVHNDLESTVLGDSRSEIKGSLTESISGDLTQEIDGDSNVSIRGNHKTNVGGLVKKSVHGDFVETVEGRKQSNYRSDMDMHVTGAMKQLIKGSVKEIIEKELKMRVREDALEFYESDFNQLIRGKSTQKVDGDQLRVYAEALHQVIGGSLKIEVSKALSLSAANGLTLKCGSNMLTIDSSGIHQASSSIAASSDEASVEAVTVEMDDIEAPVYAEAVVTQLKAEKDEQEKLGDTMNFTIEEIEVTEVQEDKKEVKKASYSDLPVMNRDLLHWQYAYSDEEAPADSMEWKELSRDCVDLSTGKAAIPTELENPYKYLHVCCFMNAQMEEGLSKVKMKWVEEFHFDCFQDILVEPETKAVAKVGVTINSGSTPLVKEQKERVYFVQIMMRSETGKNVLLGRGSDWLGDRNESGPVRKVLEGHNDWGNTKVKKLYQEQELEHFNIEILKPTKWQDNIAILEFNTLEDYWNKGSLFYFKEELKKRNTLYLFPIVVEKEKKELHPLLASQDLERFAITVETACPIMRDDPYGVYAIADGNVVFVHKDQNGKAEETKVSSYGNYVVIKHEDGSQTMYAHLESCTLEKGDEVKGGQQIGVMGNSGHRLKSKRFVSCDRLRHLHVSYFLGASASQAICPSWLDKNKHWKTKVGSPKSFIEKNHSPANTKVLVDFKQSYDLKDGRGKTIDSYKHEGLDFSGDFDNDKIPLWELGLYKKNL